MEETVLMEAMQIREERYYSSLMEITGPSIDLVGAGIVQQNTDRGRQDHFHLLRGKSGLF